MPLFLASRDVKPNRQQIIKGATLLERAQNVMNDGKKILNLESIHIYELNTNRALTTTVVIVIVCVICPENYSESKEPVDNLATS
jgi:hypothetical protein